MRQLNLVDPKRGDVGFKLTSFPDGQKLIELTDTFYGGHDPEVTITSRMSWEDVLSGNTRYI